MQNVSNPIRMFVLTRTDVVEAYPILDINAKLTSNNSSMLGRLFAAQLSAGAKFHVQVDLQQLGHNTRLNINDFLATLAQHVRNRYVLTLTHVSYNDLGIFQNTLERLLPLCELMSIAPSMPHELTHVTSLADICTAYKQFTFEAALQQIQERWEGSFPPLGIGAPTDKVTLRVECNEELADFETTAVILEVSGCFYLETLCACVAHNPSIRCLIIDTEDWDTSYIMRGHIGALLEYCETYDLCPRLRFIQGRV